MRYTRIKTRGRNEKKKEKNSLEPGRNLKEKRDAWAAVQLRTDETENGRKTKAISTTTM